MKTNKRLIACIVEILVGFMLLFLYFLKITDEFWSGMGAALIIVGVLQLIRQIRYKTNQTYKESVDVAVNDERNKYLSMKAWSWAGYFFVLIAAIATIALKICGLDEYVFFASGSICLIVLLRWISYLFLKRKY